MNARASKHIGEVARRVGGLALLIAVVLPSAGRAQEIVHGVLQLQWGDPPATAARGRAVAPRFEAWLDVGDGHRVPLDAVQARRAAGDLHGLAHRRVAVSYAAAKPEVIIDAIVPADTPQSPAVGHSQAIRTMLAAQVQGSTRWVTVMCRFADVETEQKPPAFFQAQYGHAPGQLGHYWSEVSYGRIDLAGSSAHGWYELPRPRAAYVTLVNGAPRADLAALFSDCTALADTAVDFTGAQGVNLMFNAEIDGRAWGGGACALLDHAYRCTRATWNPPWAFVDLAGLAHEMGHGYGLPHSDNSDGDGDTYDNPWDLMSDAWRHAVRDPVHGLLPKHPGMIQRERLGWVAPARKRIVPADNQEVLDFRLDAGGLRDASGVQLVVLEGAGQPDPYRTVVHAIETRRRGGTYEAGLAGDAVIIHALHDYGIARSVDAETPAADLAANEGSMFRPGEQWTTPDGRHHVQVLSATGTGFVVRVGPRARLMSAPMPAREGPHASMRTVPSAPSPARGPPPLVPAFGCDSAVRRAGRSLFCLHREW